MPIYETYIVVIFIFWKYHNEIINFFKTFKLHSVFQEINWIYSLVICNQLDLLLVHCYIDGKNNKLLINYIKII